MIGVPLQVIDISNELLEIVKAPKHGHGRYMNPCIDCHTLMVRKAGNLLKEMEAFFVITGEVLGERPKSQNINALRIVEKESGLKGYLLRPLSAKLLEPTIPEKQALVDRERLLAIRGRSRKPQLALAEKLGIEEFPTPAGGCLLTDAKFSLRLKDLLEEKINPSTNDLSLLRWGRHFRSSEGIKIVVSRQQDENERLSKLILPTDLMFQVSDYPGPIVLVRGADIGEATSAEAAMLAARYSKARNLDEVSVHYCSGDGKGAGKVVTKEPLASLQSKTVQVSMVDVGEFKKGKTGSQK